MLTKGKKFNWDHECQLAFEQLIKFLTTYPILRNPDFCLLFILYCDSSFYATGAILAKRHELNVEFVIKYASKLLKGAQLCWSVTDKELFAIIWALHHFATYLRGVRFQCVTDHKALIYLKNKKDLNHKYARYSVAIDQFDVEFVFRKGKLHGNVDILLRPVLDEPVVIEEVKTKWERQLDKFDNARLNQIDTSKQIDKDILIQFNQSNIFEDSNDSNYIDPWDDEPQLEYLKGTFKWSES